MGLVPQKKFLWVSSSISWALLLAGAIGCGRSTPIAPPIISTDPGLGYPIVSGIGGMVCGTGPYTFSNSSCLTDLASACSQVGGVLNYKTCAISANSSNIALSGTLTPDDTSGTHAGYGIIVRAGDTLSFSGSGSWGVVNNTSKTWADGFFGFSWTSYHCNKVNLNGSVDGSVGTNQGLPAGLIGAVAGTTEVFMVGKSLDNYVVKNAGVLHLGINVPSSASGVCGGYSGTMYVTVP